MAKCAKMGAGKALKL